LRSPVGSSDSPAKSLAGSRVTHRSRSLSGRQRRSALTAVWTNPHGSGLRLSACCVNGSPWKTTRRPRTRSSVSWYNDDALYIGVVSHDRSPREIVSTQLTRDADLEVDDWITVVLDPFFDHRNGLFFQ